MAVNIGKWLAYFLIFSMIVFLILAFFKEIYVDRFLDWILKIVYIAVGGTVIYIIVKIVNKK